MSYFKDIKVGDEIYGLVYGLGKVVRESDSYYRFEVEFENGHTVPYTIDGIPSWNTRLDYQTVYYKNDIDVSEFDFSPNINELLTPKQIIKLRIKGKLLVKCRSDIWFPSDKCPIETIQDFLENNQLNRFKKKPELYDVC